VRNFTATDVTCIGCVNFINLTDVFISYRMRQDNNLAESDDYDVSVLDIVSSNFQTSTVTVDTYTERSAVKLSLQSVKNPYFYREHGIASNTGRLKSYLQGETDVQGSLAVKV